MSVKHIELPGIGPVTLTKRSQSRSIRLSVTPSGVRVSLPQWTPFSAGASFALNHTAWIQAEQAKQQRPLILSGQRVGKLHYVRFEQVLTGQPTSSRVTGTEVIVRIANGASSTDSAIQKRAAGAAVRALKREADRLLPPRLTSLAQKHNLHYSSVAVKVLKRRWGSCDSHQAIVLNIYLMELPWEYIDYVLLHELTHTIHMDHSSDFWAALSRLEPNARSLSKQLRKHQPVLCNWSPQA